MRYQILAIIPSTDENKIQTIRSLLGGYGEMEQHKDGNKMLLKFDSRFPDYTNLFKRKVLARFPEASFRERERE